MVTGEPNVTDAVNAVTGTTSAANARKAAREQDATNVANATVRVSEGN